MPVNSIAPSPEAAVKVGDIFYRSWGYDQTNVNFYQVVELSPSGKTAKLREIGKVYQDETGGPHDRVSADKDNFIDSPEQHWCVNCRGALRRDGGGHLIHLSTSQADCIDDEGRETGTQATQCASEVHTRRVQYYGDAPHFTFDSFSHVSRWDGTPKYQTGSGWGH